MIIGGIGGALSMIWAKMFHKTGLEDPCDSTAGIISNLNGLAYTMLYVNSTIASFALLVC